MTVRPTVTSLKGDGQRAAICAIARVVSRPLFVQKEVPAEERVAGQIWGQATQPSNMPTSFHKGTSSATPLMPITPNGPAFRRCITWEPSSPAPIRVPSARHSGSVSQQHWPRRWPELESSTNRGHQGSGNTTECGDLCARHPNQNHPDLQSPRRPGALPVSFCGISRGSR